MAALDARQAYLDGELCGVGPKFDYKLRLFERLTGYSQSPRGYRRTHPRQDRRLNKKGMWIGGNVPLGYDASERTLVLNPAEAETVRRIFALYRELGCVRRVKEEADRLGLRTKCSTMADGTKRGGKPFSRGHIYGLAMSTRRSASSASKGSHRRHFF